MADGAKELMQSRLEYEALMERLGYNLTDKQGSHLRENPRFEFDSPEKTILIQVRGTYCALHDISLGGLSFYAPQDFGAGAELHLNFDSRFDARVRVVRVALDEQRSDEREKFFFHGSCVLDEGDGYRCSVLVLNYLSEIMQL